MPDPAGPKAHEHPFKDQRSPFERSPASLFPYAELTVTSNFTLLRGASHPDEMVQQAAALGYHAIAITDTNTLAGIVRGHVAARELGVPYVCGARLRFVEADWLSLFVYPTDRTSYGRLCRLLTVGKRRAPKGECQLMLADAIEYNAGLLAIALLHGEALGDEPFLEQLRTAFDDDRLSLAIHRTYAADDHARLHERVTLGKRLRIPLVAVNDVHYHLPERRALQDVLTCIRHGCTIEQAGYRLLANAERHLKPPEEMARLLGEWPEALQRTVEIAQRASGFSLDSLRYEYPDEIVPAGQTAMSHLKELTWLGARERYPEGLPEKVREHIEHEFALIEELQYAPYFLTVQDLVKHARSLGILCQGRGAAANSAVCYCLGVTSVNPNQIDILFERFVSRERSEPPDIDIDFEHERREEVIQYIYQKYGRERAGLTAEVITYRGRSAVRDVGKALGLSLDMVDRLAKQVNHWEEAAFEAAAGGDNEALQSLGFNSAQDTIRLLVRLTRELMGFPRHLSQHVGGFVMTQGPLCELTPIENATMENRTVIEWDKDDIEALGILKVDVLGLGMLSCIRKAFEFIEVHHARPLTLAAIPHEDPVVYDLICKADTLGVFQIESRAQMTMLPRLKPITFYDLVIEVAIVRPGPIVGDMVHPFLRRRNGEEKFEYPDAKIEKVLKKTLGIPLFQEQAMALAVTAAGFTAGEAEMLRRTISAWKTRGKDAIPRYRKRFIEGMLGNGYELKFAEQCFERLKGFSEYGFPESHSASFALLVYASAWLKCYYPAAFAAALLNSQPMGFYAPAQIVRDARDHDVEVRPADVHHSAWDCTLESDGKALRLGLRMIKGLRETDAGAIVAAVRRRGTFDSIYSLWRESGVAASTLLTLARADAFGSLQLDRQHSLWAVQALDGMPLPLFGRPFRDCLDGAGSRLPAVSEASDVLRDYQTTGLSLKSHPLAFVRSQLQRRGARTAAEIKDEQRTPHGCFASVAGIVLFRQRPATAHGVLFMTLEDETGRADLIVRPWVYERFRAAALHARVLIARGKIERDGIVIHLLASSLKDATSLLSELPSVSRDFR